MPGGMQYPTAIRVGQTRPQASPGNTAQRVSHRRWPRVSCRAKNEIGLCAANANTRVLRVHPGGPGTRARMKIHPVDTPAPPFQGSLSPLAHPLSPAVVRPGTRPDVPMRVTVPNSQWPCRRNEAELSGDGESTRTRSAVSVGWQVALNDAAKPRMAFDIPHGPHS